MNLLKQLVRHTYPFSRFIQQRDEALRNVSALLRERDEARMRLARVGGFRDAAPGVSVGLNDTATAPGLDVQSDLARLADLESRLLQFCIAPVDLAPPPAAERLDLTDDYRRRFTDTLLRTFYRDLPRDAIDDPSVRAGIDDHLDKRYLVFANHLVPWVRQARRDLSACVALEIGSGTGASTLAFAPLVKEVVCYEIDEAANDAARERLAYFGCGNVQHRNELFGPGSRFVTSGAKADIIVLCAVLEHMSFEELCTALRTAWGALSSGGLLVIADTPNRFAVMDHHTSLLPYYSALSYEVMVEYAMRYSPRAEFRDALHRATADGQRELVTRWGRGISYHDLELTIGRDVHEHVVLDGYEPTICAVAPPGIDDALMRFAFREYDIGAHRAFTRSNLYLVLRK